MGSLPEGIIAMMSPCLRERKKKKNKKKKKKKKARIT